MYKVIVATLNGIETGVWLAFHRNDIKNSDIIGQQFIQAEKQIVIPFAFHIHMEKELTGMYLRIGTAAPGNVHRRFKDLAQGLFQNLLHA